MDNLNYQVSNDTNKKNVLLNNDIFLFAIKQKIFKKVANELVKYNITSLKRTVKN